MFFVSLSMSVIRRGSSHLESEYVINVAETKEVLGQGAYCVAVKVKYGHTLCAAKQLHSILASSSDEVCAYDMSVLLDTV